MEFETIKKDNRKKYVIGVIVILAVSSVVFFVSTRANYKDEQRLNLINTRVNYSPSDLDVMAIKVQNSSGGYDTVDTVPTSGYTLNSESYCEVNGSKDASIPIEYKDGRVTIPVESKGTKCYLFFDEKPISIADILDGLTKEKRTDFSSVLTKNTTGKIYTAEDDDGTSYYYAGAVDNNWVQFGTENGSPIYWRIIRINGDGTIRLIYNGTSMVQTGTSTQINGTAYTFSHKDAVSVETYANDNAYVGYMYGTADSSTYEATHTNTNSSYVKQMVDEWYNTNLNKTGIKEKISTNAGFCGDRSLQSGTGVGTTQTYYKAYNRLSTNKVPSLKCTNENDLYTVSSANKGNKALTYPVGLITADEVAYAGGIITYNTNYSYYLYTNEYYWTMTPSGCNGSNSAYVFRGDLSGYATHGASGLRPVINLRADTLFSAGGDGTTAHPYVVE